LREAINESRTMTALGSSSVPSKVIVQMAEELRELVVMAELHSKALSSINQVIGAQAECVTGCEASCISIGLAACMMGSDIANIRQLPVTQALNKETIQQGRKARFGGFVPQLTRLARGKIVEKNNAEPYCRHHLEEAISINKAATLNVAERATCVAS
jgi:seryl-tRNA(Sec) selenium transferase